MKINENIIVKKYNIENKDETAGIVSLFNRNGSYQLSGNFKITTKDWLLTYKVKEITNFYLVILNGKIIGCSGFFRYTVRGETNQNCLFSGYLLIDGKERTGQAITKLYQEMWKKVETLPGRVLITEINPQNKASLHLSKLNGYLKTTESWEDIYNYHSFFSYLPALLRSICMDNVDNFDFFNGTVMDQKIDNNIVTICIKVGAHNIVFKIFEGNLHPYYIKIDEDTELFIEYINRKIYLNYKLENLSYKKISVCSGFITKSRSLKKKSTGRIRISNNKNMVTKVKIKSKCNTFYLLLNRNEFNNTMFEMSDIISNMTKTFIKYKSLSIFINKNNGDVIYTDNEGNPIFIDKFGEIFTKDDKKFSIQLKNMCILITMKTKEIVITKRINITNKVNINYLVKKGNSHILKIGLKILHQDYKIFDPTINGYIRFQPKKFPKESDDFIYNRLFEKRVRKYFIESINKELIVRVNGKSSDQLGYRPLILDEIVKNNVINYEYQLKNFPCMKMKNEEMDINNSGEFLLSNISFGKNSSSTCIYKIFENKKFYEDPDEKILLSKNSKEYIQVVSKTHQKEWSFNADICYFNRPKLILKDGTHILLTKNHSKIETSDKVYILDTFRNSLIKVFASNCWITSFYVENKIRLRIVGKNNTKIKITI